MRQSGYYCVRSAQIVQLALFGSVSVCVGERETERLSEVLTVKTGISFVRLIAFCKVESLGSQLCRRLLPLRLSFLFLFSTSLFSNVIINALPVIGWLCPCGDIAARSAQ